MKSESILVVDDEAQILHALEDLLEEDYEVYTSTSAEKALHIAEDNQDLAVIVSDQRMPEMQGDEFLSKVKDRSDATRILLTGYADLNAVVHAVNDGQIFAYVSKPWDPEQLRFMIRRATEFHNMAQEVKEARDLLYNLMESQPDAVYFKDANHRYLHLNKTELEFLDVDRIEDALGRPPSAVMPPFWAQDRLTIEKTVLRSGKPVVDHKTEKTDSDGRPRWFSTSMAPVLNDHGDIYRLVGITREITKQRWIEKENQLVFEITHTVVDAQTTSSALGQTLQKIREATNWAYGEAWLRDTENGGRMAYCPEWSAAENLKITDFRNAISVATTEHSFGAVRQVQLSKEPLHLTTREAVQENLKNWGIHVPDLPFGGMLAVPIPDQDGAIIAVLIFYMSEARKVDEPMARMVVNTAARLGSGFHRKETERALATSESRFRDVAEVASDWIWEITEDGRLSYISSRFEEIMGIPRKMIVGEQAKVLTESDENENGWRILESFLNEQQPFKNIEIVMVDAQGQAHDLSLSGKPIYDDDGQFGGFRGTTADFTEQKRIQRALTESKSRFIEILDNASIAISVKDTNGQYTLINNQFEAFFNTKTAEILGKTASDVFDPAIAKKMQDKDSIVTERQLSEEFELSLDLPQGTRTFLTNHFPLYDIDKKVDGICSIYTDITEWKRLEEHLTQSSKMEAIGQLTGGVAHDFNNLLTVIMGNLELLQRTVTGDGQSKWLKTALRAASRGADLTSRLLAFSRRQVLEPKVVKVNNNLSELAPMARRTIGENINIVLDLDDNLRPVMIDESQLESALLNLIVNARDAMPNGGTITIAARNLTIENADKAGPYYDLPTGPYMQLTVSDTGQGMSAELQSRVLEPFFTTKERGKGTGLGLSMVYGFVKQSEGYFYINSAEGAGCTIEMLFPAADGDVAECQDSDAPTDGSPASATILVIEDDDDIRSMAVEALAEAGFRVHHASTGPDALSLVDSLPEIHLIVADIATPGGIDGYEIAETAQRRHKDVDIIISSGYPEREDSPTQFNWIRKPYLPSQLVSAAHRVLSDSDTRNIQDKKD